MYQPTTFGCTFGFDGISHNMAAHQYGTHLNLNTVLLNESISSSPPPSNTSVDE